MANTCEHRFVFGGLRYKHGGWPLPGTGAEPRYYFDWMFCERCCESRYLNQREIGTSYDAVIGGATPAGEEIRV